MDNNELREAVEELTVPAKAWLVEQFGMVEASVHGFAYHNRDHGDDVSSAAERIASELYAARRVPWETVLLAPYAGWRHDAAQGNGHERRSAQIAAQSMRERGIPERHIATVEKMILGTEVRGIDGYRIVQAADPNDPEQALLADADLASLGRKGVYPALLLGLEQQHLNGLITLPSPTDGTGVEPDREAMIMFLRFQFGLYHSHQYLLEVSRALFPHQEANRDEIGRLLELYTADRISYSGMLVSARRLALGEPTSRAFVAPANPPLGHDAGTQPKTKSVTIVVIDMVDSVRLTAELSAVENYRFFADYLRLLRGVIENATGTLLSEQGDGVIVAFEDPARALDFAAASHLAVRPRHERDSTAIAIRTGVSVGQVATGPAGTFGRPMGLAARLCSAAHPSEILISDALYHEVAEQPGLTFDHARDIELKGFGTVIAHRLTWA